MVGKQVVAELEAVLRARGFKEAEQEMRSAKRETDKFAKGLDNVMRSSDRTAEGMTRARKATSKFNQAANQASFGLQDFMIVIGNGGLGPALRGASNNAAQMAFILGSGGLGGAVAGLSLTFASLIPDMLGMGKGTKKTTDKFKEQTAAIKALTEAHKEFGRGQRAVAGERGA